MGIAAVLAANEAGYGIHYPIRHGQIENWVWRALVDHLAATFADEVNRITWSGSGRTPSSNTYE